MTRKLRHAILWSGILALSVLLTAPARADIIVSGDVSPDPATTEVGDSITVGPSGSLTINGGSTVECSNGTILGTATVDGPGSLWSAYHNIYVQSKLTVINGGTVEAGLVGPEEPYGVLVGLGAGIEGRLVVDGIGSTVTSDSVMEVGWGGGVGHVEITGGASVASVGAYLGLYNGGQGNVKVDGAGSSWTSGVLHVGWIDGEGTVEITGGADVYNNVATIGSSDEAIGFVQVDGAGSTWTVNNWLAVGSDSGTGTLEISGGASVASATGMVGFDSGTGTVSVSGDQSRWDNSGTLTVGQHGGSGALEIQDGGQVSATQATIWSGIVSGDGGTLAANALNHGTIAPGNSAGTLTIDGDFTQSLAGLLEIELAGLTAGSGYDQLLVTGDASLDGTLDVSLIEGFVLGANQWFHILPVGGSLSGIFAGLGEGDVVGTYGGTDLFITYNAGGVALYTVPEPSGWVLAGCGALVLVGIARRRRGGGLKFISQTRKRVKHAEKREMLMIHTVPHAKQLFGLLSTACHPVQEAPHMIRTSGFTLARLGVVYAVFAALIVFALPVRAAVTVFGDVAPNPATTTLSDDLFIGNTGSGVMITTAGSGVESRFGYLGYSSGSEGNVFVVGIGSTWTTSTALTVGRFGNGTLQITDGGAVNNLGGAIIGNFSDSTANVTVNGAGSSWTNGLGLRVGIVGDATLEISGGGVVSSSTGSVGDNFGSTGSVTVEGAGSTWTNSSSLSVGLHGAGALEITGGGTVNSAGGIVGQYSGSTGGVTVDGTGSTWSNSSTLYIGEWGQGALTITGGGAVNANSQTIVGRYAGSTGNVAVAGPGSTWTNGYLNLGSAGEGTLEITAGGAVSSTGGRIAEGSRATVEGADSTWTNSSSFLDIFGTLEIMGGGAVNSSILSRISGGGRVTVDGAGSSMSASVNVGSNGAGTLEITGGGAVSGTNARIGNSSGSTGSVTVDGPGSLWTNSSSLYVGDSGQGTLAIAGGGTVSNMNGTIGLVSGSTGSVVVDGAASAWTNSSFLTVGSSGAGTLEVTGGGTVSNSEGRIGSAAGSTGSVTVDGAGSTWTNSGSQFVVGSSGAGTLAISGGGAVSSLGLYSFIGSAAGSTGSVTVDGADSLWNSSGLHVGRSGDGTLEITGGGTVNSSDQSYIAREVGSTGQVIVDGAGSTWTNSSALYVGYSGIGTLVITSGGEVNSSSSTIGLFGSMSSVTVDGAGSTWTNSSVLTVGASGASTLKVTGGGAVSNSEGRIGFDAGSTGSVTVDGAGSTWTNSQQLAVGYFGAGTLEIAAGATVGNTDGFIGRWSGSTGTVTVDGGAWINSGSLYIGGRQTQAGGTGTLNIMNGGLVSVGGTLKLWNNGTVNLYAGGTLQAGTLDAALGTLNFFGGSFTGAGPGQTTNVNVPVTVSEPTPFDAAIQEIVNYNAPITGSATVTKTGLGTVVQHADSQLGNLVVDNGTWKVANTATLIADVVVNPGGTFGGSGALSGDVVLNGGTISPGDSPGTFTSADAKIDLAGGTYLWEINRLEDFGGAAGDATGWDLWNAGNLSLDGTLKINLVSLDQNDLIGGLQQWDASESYQWLIATSDNAAFADLSKLQIDPHSVFFALNGVTANHFSLQAGELDLGALYLHYSPVPVPEPGTAVLAMLAAAALLWWKKRK